MRYLGVGAVNTVATYAIFVLLGLVITPGWAYTVAYLVGLVWVVFGSSRFVFGGGRPWQLVLFAAWYLAVYGVGRLVVLLIAPRGLRALLVTSVVIVAITVPLSFVGGRYIFRPTATTEPDTKAAPHEGEGA